jgi:demethylmenaquinone methyltransferase/2-methoxy-6-polyprenyl-1,4-benzoquinol methylase
LKTGDAKDKKEIVMRGDVGKNPVIIKEMFDAIAEHYDRLNTLMSFGLHHCWSKFAVSQTGLQPGAVALDVCCGTGSLTGLLMQKTQPNGRIIGLDLAPNMLKIARRRLDTLRSKSSFRLIQGNANTLPFPDDVFDCAVIGYGLRNVPEPRRVLAEMRRVVKPGKKIIALEIAEPQLPFFKELYRLYLATIIPRLGKWVAHNESAYQYLYQSIIQFNRQNELSRLFENNGIIGVKTHLLTCGIAAVSVGVKKNGS